MFIEPLTPHHLQDIARVRRFPQLEINLQQIMNDKTLLMRYCIQVLKNKADKRTTQEIELLKTFAETVTFFANLKLNDEEGNIIERCVQVLKHQHLEENEVLFRVGDPGSLFYIILEGAVGIYIKLPSQSDPNKMELKEINVLRAGASFGELALLNENVQRSATIVAKCDCELAIMEKRDFKALLGQMERYKVEKKISFLCQFPFFQAWSFREVRTISYHFEEVVCTFNTKIYSRGDPSDYFYVVREGVFELNLDIAGGIQQEDLQLTRSQPDHRRICQLGQGEFFGEETFLLDGKGFTMKLPRQDLPKKSKHHVVLSQHTEEPRTEEAELMVPIVVKKDVPKWSRRVGDVYCMSQSGLVYRISREDIQRRFWESKTQSIFLRLLSAIFQFRMDRIMGFKDQRAEAQREQHESRQIQHYLDLAAQQGHVIQSTSSVTSRRVSAVSDRMSELISNGVFYRLKRREEAEDGSMAQQLVEQAYRDEIGLQELAMKQFSQLFKIRNYSFAQVKNFFTQKHLVEQSMLDKASYRKLMFRFRERKQRSTPTHQPKRAAPKPGARLAYQKLSEIVATPKMHKLQTICLDSYMHSMPRDASFASDSKNLSQEHLMQPTLSTTVNSIKKTSTRIRRLSFNNNNSQESQSLYQQQLRNASSFKEESSTQLFSVTRKQISYRPKSSIEAERGKKR